MNLAKASIYKAIMPRELMKECLEESFNQEKSGESIYSPINMPMRVEREIWQSILISLFQTQ
jgi:hypothetical protein